MRQFCLTQVTPYCTQEYSQYMTRTSSMYCLWFLYLTRCTFTPLRIVVLCGVQYTPCINVYVGTESVLTCAMMQRIRLHTKTVKFYDLTYNVAVVSILGTTAEISDLPQDTCQCFYPWCSRMVVTLYFEYLLYLSY